MFLLGGVLFYLHSGIVKTAKELTDIERLRAELLGQESGVLTVKKSLQNTEVGRREIDSYFISNQNNVATFATAIEANAKQIDLSPEVTLETGEVEIFGETKDILHTTISVSGSFNKLYQYLQALEQIPYKVSFSSVTLASYGQTSFDEKTSSVQTKWTLDIAMDVLSYNTQ